MKKIDSDSGKPQTIRRIAYAVFSLEDLHGHLKWKITDLGRKVKISRSLIYEYLGSTKKDILSNSVRVFINDFYGFNGDSQLSPSERIKNARSMIIKNPETVFFYHKWRSKNSWLHQEFVEVEKKFRKKLNEESPTLKEKEVLALHALIHGVVTSPFLTPDQASDIFQLFQLKRR